VESVYNLGTNWVKHGQTGPKKAYLATLSHLGREGQNLYKHQVEGY
jgi:hypothetical protein